VVPGRVQQPITNFTRPRDDFMVHGINNPSSMQVVQSYYLQICKPFNYDVDIEFIRSHRHTQPSRVFYHLLSWALLFKALSVSHDLLVEGYNIRDCYLGSICMFSKLYWLDLQDTSSYCTSKSYHKASIEILIYWFFNRIHKFFQLSSGQ